MSYRSINRVVLVGRLTRDPELRELTSGQSVCELRLACNASRREPDGGYRERPNYFDVSAFGVQAENVARYLHKGSAIAVDGRLEWREWETAETGEGNSRKRQAVRVLADSVQFLDSRATAAAHEELAGDGDAPPDGSAAQDVELREVELVF
jgi:single-strand DNA-binding protein